MADERLYEMQGMSTSYQKIEPLQWLRALAFIGIFISHSNIGDFSCFGAFGVSVFLVLSGFLLSYKYISVGSEPERAVVFAWRKIKKLYPLHLLMLFMCILLEFIKGSLGRKTLVPIILHVGMLQIWCPAEPIYATLNGPAWYLCVCFFCYLLFPTCLRILRKYSNTQTAIYNVFFLFICQVLIALMARTFLSGRYSDFFSMKYAVYFFPPSRFLDFAIGLHLGLLFAIKRSWGGYSLLTNLSRVFCLPIVAVACYFYHRQLLFLGVEYTRYTLQMIVPACMAVWCFASMKQRQFKVLEWIGNMSPFAFLIHGVMIKYVRLFITQKYILFAIAFCLTLAMSYLYSVLINHRRDLIKEHQ